MANCTEAQLRGETLHGQFSHLLSVLAQCSSVTTNSPFGVSIAWDTIRSNIISSMASNFQGADANESMRYALRRAEDLIDHAPTLRFRGTP